eukprot:3092048-Rhodomonas_salina.2
MSGCGTICQSAWYDMPGTNAAKLTTREMNPPRTNLAAAGEKRRVHTGVARERLPVLGRAVPDYSEPVCSRAAAIDVRVRRAAGWDQLPGARSDRQTQAMDGNMWRGRKEGERQRQRQRQRVTATETEAER